MDVLCYLKEFQTLVTGAVGFLGVIATLIVNARLARQQRDQEVRLSREQREDGRAHERSTIRAAILAELKINRSAIQENLDRMDEGAYDEANGVLVPTDSMDAAYRAFLPKIGLLPEDEATMVMMAYLTMESHTGRLYLIDVSSERSSQYVKLTGDAIQLAGNMQRALLEPIDEAIAALENAGTAP